MSIGDEREKELQRRANRKKLTIPQLRQELTKHNIGYMSNWTKPVLLRRLEENDKWLDYQANQIDAFQAFRDKKENLQGQADDLLKEMEALNDAKNSLAKRRVKILEEVKKLDAVIEMTEPTF
jgi:D-mannonate dehydratase